MARPTKKREFRRIVVDDSPFQWCFDGVLTVYADSNTSRRGQKLIIDWGWVDWCEPEYQNTRPFDPHVVTPAFVRSAIQYALTAGWIPAVAGQPFVIAYADGEFAPRGAT